MELRLKPFEIDVIVKQFKLIFAPNDKLWLFGSRANMERRGGDIDLYIETNLMAEQAFDAKINLINNVCDQIGDQRIDIVLNILSSDKQIPIYAKARREGVQLV